MQDRAPTNSMLIVPGGLVSPLKRRRDHKIYTSLSKRDMSGDGGLGPRESASGLLSPPHLSHRRGGHRCAPGHVSRHGRSPDSFDPPGAQGRHRPGASHRGLPPLSCIPVCDDRGLLCPFTETLCPLAFLRAQAQGQLLCPGVLGSGRAQGVQPGPRAGGS